MLNTSNIDIDYSVIDVQYNEKEEARESPREHMRKSAMLTPMSNPHTRKSMRLLRQYKSNDDVGNTSALNDSNIRY